MAVSKTQTKRKGIGKGTPGPGRPKGSKDKFSKLKDEFVKVYQHENGYKHLTRLLESQPEMFFKLMASLFPKEVKASIESHNTYEVRGLQESMALAEEATAGANVVPLQKSGTD